MTSIMTANYIFLTIILALLLIIFGPLGTWLEASMFRHVLIELPLLIGLGISLGYYVPTHLQRLLYMVNAGGIFGLISITIIILFWMLPRYLDASISNYFMGLAKYLSLLFAGTLLSLSWPYTHLVTRGVIKIEFLTMLFRLGWLYLISPVRLCNNYLISEQIILGRGFIIIAFALGITWLIPVFFNLNAQPDKFRQRHEL